MVLWMSEIAHSKSLAEGWDIKIKEIKDLLSVLNLFNFFTIFNFFNLFPLRSFLF